MVNPVLVLVLTISVLFMLGVRLVILKCLKDDDDDFGCT